MVIANICIEKSMVLRRSCILAIPIGIFLALMIMSDRSSRPVSSRDFYSLTNFTRSVTSNRIMDVAILSAKNGLVRVWTDCDSDHERTYVLIRTRFDWKISNGELVGRIHDPEWQLRQLETLRLKQEAELAQTRQQLENLKSSVRTNRLPRLENHP